MPRLEGTIADTYSTSGDSKSVQVDSSGKLIISSFPTTTGVSGLPLTIGVSGLPLTIGVSGLPATHAVSGTVMISGTHTITGTVTVSDTPRTLGLSSVSTPITAFGGLDVPIHDYIGLSYDGSSNLTGVDYQKSSVTVATLTLGYTSSNALSSVSKV
jgi:hypothetical protein